MQIAHKYPGQVSIYPAGALTDIALAMRMDPQCASLAKDLVVMGGYVDLHLPADYQVRGESLCCSFVVSLVLVPMSMLQYINEFHDRFRRKPPI